jgi:hypothetical protein
MVDEIETGEAAPAPAADEDLSLTSEITAAVERQRGGGDKSEPAETGSGGKDTEVHSEGRARDEHGRFVAKAPSEESETEVPKEAAEPKDDGEAPKVAPDAPKPPAGFSAASKAQWDKLPDAVKADIAKREVVVADGFKQFSRYDGLGKFADLCERNGTNLTTAVAQYNQLENLFVRDPVAGITAICQRLNIDPRILTSAMQAHYGGLLGPQGQQQPSQPPAVNGYQQHQLNPEALINEAVNRFNQQQSERDTQSQISAFMADPANRYFENVRPQMVAALQSGQASTLKEAYDAALWMNPETRAIMLQEEKTKAPTQRSSVAAATQAKAAAKAVGGSPRPGLKSGGAIDPNASVTDTIIAAINAQRGVV